MAENISIRITGVKQLVKTNEHIINDVTITYNENDYKGNNNKAFYSTIPILNVGYDTGYEDCKYFNSKIESSKNSITYNVLDKGSIFNLLSTWCVDENLNPTKFIFDELYTKDDTTINAMSNVYICIKTTGGYITNCEIIKDDNDPLGITFRESHKIVDRGNVNNNSNPIASQKGKVYFAGMGSTYKEHINKKEQGDAAAYSYMMGFEIYDSNLKNSGKGFMCNTAGPSYYMVHNGGIQGSYHADYDYFNLAKERIDFTNIEPFHYGSVARYCAPFVVHYERIDDHKIPKTKEDIVNLLKSIDSKTSKNRAFLSSGEVYLNYPYNYLSEGIISQYYRDEAFYKNKSWQLLDEFSSKNCNMYKFSYDYTPKLNSDSYHLFFDFNSGDVEANTSGSKNKPFKDVDAYYDLMYTPSGKEYPGTLTTAINTNEALINFFSESTFVDTKDTQQAEDSANKDTSNQPAIDEINNNGGIGIGSNGTSVTEVASGGNGNFNYQGDKITFTDTSTIPSVTDSGFITTYVLSKNDLNKISTWLWSKKFLDNVPKMFQDPMDSIISLQMTYAPVKSSSGNVVIGTVDSDITANVLDQQYYDVDFGTITVPSSFGSDDYTTYMSKCSIMLPFIGMYSLDINDVIGSSIALKYHIDALTGACTCEIQISKQITSNGKTNDVLCIPYTLTGNVNQSLPITGKNYAEWYKGIVKTGVNLL